jgi:hypothetical protein
MSKMANALQAYEELEAMWNVYDDSLLSVADEKFIRYAITEHTAHVKKQLELPDVAFAEGAMIYAEYRATAGELSLSDSLEISNPLFRYYEQPWNAAKASHEVAA